LLKLADYVCFREFPHLLTSRYCANNEPVTNDRLPIGTPERYIELFREVTKCSAYLIAEWLRVGFVQGNMNSDNTLLGGRTIDYGPFGWMEKYDPYYQPFTSDADGNFTFIRQANAMSVNISVLGESAFKTLIRNSVADPLSCDVYLHFNELNKIADEEFQCYFDNYYSEVKRQKLGFKSFSGEHDEQLWTDLTNLMLKSGSDYTILFRELSKAADCKDLNKAFEYLQLSFYDHISQTDHTEWLEWLEVYLHHIKMDNLDPNERKTMQNNANPKYVLRNWMSTLAYEKAIKENDYSIINELLEVLEHPYDEQSSEIEMRWYKKTPDWATNLPGVAFMSCSS